MPGPSRPKLRITSRPSRPRRGLDGVGGRRAGRSGTPCGMTSTRRGRRRTRSSSSVAADRDMTTVASASRGQLDEDLRAGAGSACAGRCGAWRPRAMSRAADEVEDGLAVLAAPDPVLVLDRDDVDAPDASGHRRRRGSRPARRGGCGGGLPSGTATPRPGEDAGRRPRGRSTAARSCVKVAMPQRRGGYVETKAVRTMTDPLGAWRARCRRPIRARPARSAAGTDAAGAQRGRAAVSVRGGRPSGRADLDRARTLGALPRSRTRRARRR